MPKSIKLYETEIATLLSLPEKQRSHILTAILCGCLEKEIPELDAMEKAIYTLIKEQIKRAEELSNRRKQNANSRWKDNANDMQSVCTNTITNTITSTSTNNTPPTPSKGAGGAKKQTAKPQPEKIQFAEFVSMTNDEYTSLVAEVGEQGAKRCIEILDNYKGANGKTYKSDYRAILNWVVKRYEEEKSKSSVQTMQPPQASDFDPNDPYKYWR